MSMKLGATENLEDLKEYIRLKSVPCGRCLLWQGSTDKDGVPRMRVPWEDGKSKGVRRTLLKAMGVNVDGKLATTSCDNVMCVSDKHAVAWTRKRLQGRSSKKQTGNVSLSMQRAVNGRRTGKLTMDKVREMRSSGLSYRKAADTYGVTFRTVQKIMRGESWREYGSPFSGLGA